MRRRVIAMMLLAGPILAVADINAGDAVATEPREAGPVVTVRVRCEAMLPAYCQGHYGFEVAADGTWRVGPRPDGRVLSGRLQEPEARRLREAAERALGRSSEAPPACAAVGPIPGVSERVSATAGDRTLTLTGGGGRLDPACAATGGREYRALFALAHRLMLRFYPHPF
jgi:hypothetical protein